MESDHEELYLQKLRGYIFDEDKVVTCAWLSKSLDLDLISCKQLLNLLIKDTRGSKAADLAVTYVLVGTLLEDSLRGIFIVKEDELEDKKKLFKNADESVYSVQKSKSIDLNIISMVDMMDINNPPEKPMVGSVIGKNCIKRNLKVKKALPTVNRAAPTDKSKASHLFSKTSTKSETKCDTKVSEQKNTEGTKAKESDPVKPNNKVQNKGKVNGNQKGSLAALFSQVPPKSEPKKESPKRIKLEESEKKSPKEMEMEVDDEPEPEKKVDSIKKEKFYDSDTDEEANKIEQHNKKKAAASVNGQNKKKKNSVKRARKDNSAERPQKRRKRIINKNESDSDDIFGDDNEETEDVIVESDDETVYKKVPASTIAPKNKKRTLVDKTYIDDEGYMITKKEWISESASEDEENKEQNRVSENKNSTETEKVKKAEPVKEVSPTKGQKNKNKGKQNAVNQPSIMSFFKKK